MRRWTLGSPTWAQWLRSRALSWGAWRSRSRKEASVSSRPARRSSATPCSRPRLSVCPAVGREEVSTVGRSHPCTGYVSTLLPHHPLTCSHSKGTSTCIFCVARGLLFSPKPTQDRLHLSPHTASSGRPSRMMPFGTVTFHVRQLLPCTFSSLSHSHIFSSPTRRAVPNLFCTRDWFHGRQFFHGQGWGRGGRFRW